MAKIPPPNYTQSPNVFYDEVLPEINSLAELKVTDVIIRQTFGWHIDECEMSLSKLMKLTGMTRQSVFDGLKHGLERGTIARRPNGRGFLYRLSIVQNLDHVIESDSPESRLPPVQNLDRQTNENGTDSRPTSVKKLDRPSIDKERKKIQDKEKDSALAGAPPSFSKPETDHQRLMREVYELFSSIDLPGAQGKSAKRMLTAHHSVNDIITLMREQVRELKPKGWRSSVTLMSVEKDISSWKLSRNGYGKAQVGKHVDDSTEFESMVDVPDRIKELGSRTRTPEENEEYGEWLARNMTSDLFIRPRAAGDN